MDNLCLAAFIEAGMKAVVVVIVAVVVVRRNCISIFNSFPTPFVWFEAFEVSTIVLFFNFINAFLQNSGAFE